MIFIGKWRYPLTFFRDRFPIYVIFFFWQASLSHFPVSVSSGTWIKAQREQKNIPLCLFQDLFTLSPWQGAQWNILFIKILSYYIPWQRDREIKGIFFCILLCFYQGARGHRWPSKKLGGACSDELLFLTYNHNLSSCLFMFRLWRLLGVQVCLGLDYVGIMTIIGLNI